MAQRPNTQQEEDNLTRFRLVHPDKDVRALSKRLHRLPYLPQSTDDEQKAVDFEKGALEIEVLKFAAGVERTVRGANRLSKQREHYLRLKAENLERAAALEAQVTEEKELLIKSRAELEHAVHCDSLAKVIRGRPKTRRELDALIADLQESVASHRATHAAYLAAAQSRIEAMSAITNAIQEAQSITLNLDPDAAPPALTSGPASDLSAAAPSFRPKRPAEEVEAGEIAGSATESSSRKKRRSTPDGPRRVTSTTSTRSRRGEKEDGEHEGS